MLIRASRFAVVAAATIVGVSACDGCDGTPPETRATLVAQFPNGTTLTSNGRDTLALKLVAKTEARDPDVAPITITPAGGSVRTIGATAFESELTASPDANGELEFEFICPAGAAESVSLTATNGSATASFSVSCRAADGTVAFDVDDSDCDNLQADGESTCVVEVTASRDGTAASGESLTVNVREPAQAPRLSAGVGAPAATVTISLNDDGVGTFLVHVASGQEGAAETIILDLNVGESAQELIVDVGPFEDRTKLDFGGSDDAVIGGLPATLKLKVTAPNGQPPEAPRNVVQLDITNGDASFVSAANVEIGDEGGATVTLNADGTADVQLDTEEVGDPTEVTVRATYDYLANRDPLVQTHTVIVNEEGALILNVVADPAEVASDVPGATTTELTVTFTKEGGPVPDGLVTLTITNPARLRFGTNPNNANAPSELVLDEDDFNAEGEATVDVTALTGVAPGTVTIEAEGTDPERRVRDNVAVTVEREPILQSMTPLAPEPAVIGVRGSALATSSIVKFELRDDRNNPMPGVAVTFSSPDTADQGIVIGESDISDASGQVQTVVSSGTIAGPIIVNATAVSGDVLLTVASSQIAVIGGLPNHQFSFMACSSGIPLVEGQEFSCTATLVDRFSEVTPGQTVQFRSEGSGTTAIGNTDDSGRAEASLALDDGDTRSATSVPAWSFGFVPTASTAGVAAGCFDGTVTTPCDLLALCDASPAHCPLPQQCTGRADVAAGLMLSGISATDIAEMTDYLADFRACGFPVACLLGDPDTVGGVDDFEGDECSVAIGCMDYSAATECPHDGLVTVIGSTRGEESFNDGNGNGVLDFTDTNGDGQHSFGEPLLTRAEQCLFGTVCELSGDACNTSADCGGEVDLDAIVDLPEPFLDKNDNCYRDDLTSSPRLSFTPSQKVRHSDLFSDVDGNHLFGFTQGTQLLEKNAVFDSDTDVFLTAHVLTFGAAGLDVGIPCTPGTAGCVELADGAAGVNPAAVPSELGLGESIDLDYRWADSNGNCVSEGLDDEATVSVEGPITISGDEKQVLDDSNCGFLSGPNSLTPYCEDLPFLGAPVGSLTVKEDCGDTTEPEVAKVRFTLGANTRTVTFDVPCGAP